mgnify:CR=1 FL=1
MFCLSVTIVLLTSILFVSFVSWLAFGQNFYLRPLIVNDVVQIKVLCNGELALHFQLLLFTLLILLVSVLASAKPAWLNFSQHRGPTNSYNNGSEKRQTDGRVLPYQLQTINTTQKGHRVSNTKDLNKNWLATWQLSTNTVCWYYELIGRNTYPQCIAGPQNPWDSSNVRCKNRSRPLDVWHSCI